jgi:hypothetical protein
MKRLVIAAILCIAATSAQVLLASRASADIIVSPHLSGTGDNVIADSTSTTSALGHLNGTHLDVVDYTGLTAGFIGAAHGNDIKIDNTVGINVQVFDPTNTFVVPTFTQVFSLKGTGDILMSVVANDGTFNFNLGNIDPNAQSGFTVSALNGESIISLSLLDVGGNITDFEHNRIDIAPLAVPLPIVGAGLPGLLGGLFALAGLAWRRRSSFSIR